MTLRAMSLDRPASGLVAEGLKWIETRGRDHPWRSAIGEVIAIHATVKKPKPQEIGPFTVWNESGAVWWLDGRGGDPESNRYWPLVAGSIVALARVADVVPITWKGYVARYLPGYPCVTYQTDGPLELHTGKATVNIEDQRPFGTFCYERYAIPLVEVEKLAEPIPCRGYQGLWRVPVNLESMVRDSAGRF